MKYVTSANAFLVATVCSVLVFKTAVTLETFGAAIAAFAMYLTSKGR